MRKLSAAKKIGLIAKAALAKKAKELVLMDLRRLCAICDYFIIASGSSTTHLDAIADNVEKEMAENGVRPGHREGRADSLWLLLDYGDIIVHIFHSQTRHFYNLERLWHDAPQKKLAKHRKA